MKKIIFLLAAAGAVATLTTGTITVQASKTKENPKVIQEWKEPLHVTNIDIIRTDTKENINSGITTFSSGQDIPIAFKANYYGGKIADYPNGQFLGLSIGAKNVTINFSRAAAIVNPDGSSSLVGEDVIHVGKEVTQQFQLQFTITGDGVSDVQTQTITFVPETSGSTGSTDSSSSSNTSDSTDTTSTKDSSTSESETSGSNDPHHSVTPTDPDDSNGSEEPDPSTEPTGTSGSEEPQTTSESNSTQPSSSESVQEPERSSSVTSITEDLDDTSEKAVLKPDTKSSDSTKNLTLPKNNSSKRLPKTSEENSIALTLGGIITLIGTIGLIIKRKL